MSSEPQNNPSLSVVMDVAHGNNNNHLQVDTGPVVHSLEQLDASLASDFSTGIENQDIPGSPSRKVASIIMLRSSVVRCWMRFPMAVISFRQMTLEIA